MPIFVKNVDLGKPLRISSWRKIAIGTWKTAGDPSVYGFTDVDMGPALEYIEKLRQETGKRITLTHFVGKAVANVIHRTPQINCILRFGRLYPRKSVDLFFQVAADSGGEDLSGMTVRGAENKSVLDICVEMEERVRKIREKKDTSYTQVKKTMGLIPGILAYPALWLTSFIMYTLNLWTPLLGAPRDSFGSVMITNIGSIGLDAAFAPLVPYSRVPLLVTIGGTQDKAIVRNGQIVIGPVMKLTVTFDHRLIDGVHAASLYKHLMKIFAEPETELSFAKSINWNK